MPNTENITRPITLIAFGRSGTSLTTNILSAHPDVEACGETAPLIFGTYAGAMRLEGIVRGDPTLPKGADHRARAGKAVRGAFLAMFPDGRKPEWTQKPIKVPWTIQDKQRRNPRRFEAATVQYWQAMSDAFPESRNITILRHPYDVVISAAKYWENPVDQIWRNIVLMAQIIDHPDNTITHAVNYRRLTEDPKPEVDRLLDHVGLSLHPACHKAVDTVYVAKRGTHKQAKAAVGAHAEKGFSHQDRWADLDTSGFTTAEHDVLVKCWDRFGVDLTF